MEDMTRGGAKRKTEGAIEGVKEKVASILAGTTRTKMKKTMRMTIGPVVVAESHRNRQRRVRQADVVKS